MSSSMQTWTMFFTLSFYHTIFSFSSYFVLRTLFDMSNGWPRSIRGVTVQSSYCFLICILLQFHSLSFLFSLLLRSLSLLDIHIVCREHSRDKGNIREGHNNNADIPPMKSKPVCYFIISFPCFFLYFVGFIIVNRLEATAAVENFSNPYWFLSWTSSLTLFFLLIFYYLFINFLLFSFLFSPSIQELVSHTKLH